ncbi:MAG: hypothetical protein ACREBS_10780 [Nitrososphaerales archaeon]
MALTIEPRIYLPCKFGVGIEDDQIVKDNGLENRSKKLSHELIEL